MPDDTYDITGKRIYVAGHNGMVGRALVRRLHQEECEILTIDRQALDLRNQQAVNDWFCEHKPDCVINAAARVGGIGDNDAYPADYFTDNILIQTNLMSASHDHDAERFIMLGSSCIYPKMAENPIPEDALLTGALEATNESYAIAKIAGLQMVKAYRKQYGRDYIALMPCNLYGPHDRFDHERGHVMAALMMKAYDAVQNDTPFVVWGTGKPRREFMHVDDAADGTIHALRHYNGDIAMNMGVGSDLTITDLAQKIADIAGYTGGITYDQTKPDGTPRKLMNNAQMYALGWQPQITLDDGIQQTYQWYIDNVAK